MVERKFSNENMMMNLIRRPIQRVIFDWKCILLEYEAKCWFFFFIFTYHCYRCWGIEMLRKKKIQLLWRFRNAISFCMKTMSQNDIETLMCLSWETEVTFGYVNQNINWNKHRKVCHIITSKIISGKKKAQLSSRSNFNENERSYQKERMKANPFEMIWNQSINSR